MNSISMTGLVVALCLATPMALGQEPETGPADESQSQTRLEDPGGAETDEDAEEDEGSTFIEQQTATLRALDKITGRSTDFSIEVGAPVLYGSLKIELKTCFQTPPEEPPESAAFLQIATTENLRMQSVTEPRLASEVQGVGGSGIDAEALAEANDESERSSAADGSDTPDLLFSGWMFASSPGLSALEHSVYDVWVIRCTQRSPESESSPGEPAE